MLRILHRLLLSLPPDIAHALARWALFTYQLALKFKVSFTFNLKPVAVSTFRITRSNSSVAVLNRVGLAAGFDKNAELFYALSKFQFGFMELGTVTPLPQSGNAKPRLWRAPNGALVNHMGFNNVGFNAFRGNIQRLRRYVHVPLWINLGKNSSTPIEEAHEDYFLLFDELKSVADAFVVNLSSPNTPGLRSLQNETFVLTLMEKVPDLPLFLKLSPDLPNEELKLICELVKSESRITGLVLTNTSRDLASKLTGHANGGLSGRPLFERSVECMTLAREMVKDAKILVGVGGIDSVKRAKTMQAAGADLIELYTGFVYQGPPLVRAIAIKLV